MRDRSVFRRLMAMLLALALVLTLAGACCAEGEEDALLNALRSAEGISAVEVMPECEDAFVTTYLLHFRQLIDPSDPEAGTFEQRVVLKHKKGSTVTVYHVSGYMLGDMLDPNYFQHGISNELAKHYGASYVDIEYRFFGKSLPEGMAADDVRLAEYLTSENACADFHRIITTLQGLMSGGSIFTGGSKGGYTTATMAYFYPDDADAYVSISAPLCAGRTDPAMYSYVYQGIGDDTYGPEKAAEYRQLVLDFQLEALAKRDVLAPRYYELGTSQGCRFTEYCTPDVLYDIVVLEFGAQIWQSWQDFDLLRQVLALKEQSEVYTEVLFSLLVQMTPPEMLANNSPFFPYLLQAATEMGNYHIDFSGIRAELEKQQSQARLTVTEEMEPELEFRLSFTPEQLSQLHYSDALRSRLIQWLETTETELLLLYGASDPWYAVGLPECDNPNIHRFVSKIASHAVNSESLTGQDRAEFFRIIDRLIAP